MEPGRGGGLSYDSSAIRSTLDYLSDRSSENLNRLVSTPGNRLAYQHYLWSTLGSALTIEEFWKSSLEHIVYSRDVELRIDTIWQYLETQEQSRWLEEILKCLPARHVFHSTIYPIIGYDNVAFNEDVALNLGFNQFHADPREASYYLIHELAHAGYYQYHPMPDLHKIKSQSDLLWVVKFLTHLEGMGVFSCLRLRVAEGGLLDKDYKVLFDDAEKSKRISAYFYLLSTLEEAPSRDLQSADFGIFDQMSGPTTRLWYIAGCHMAQTIGAEYGEETLRELVKKGHEDFFKAYKAVKGSLHAF